MRSSRRSVAPSDGPRVFKQEIGDRLDIVEIDHRHLRLRQSAVGRHRHDVRVFRVDQRLAVGDAVDLDLGKGIALEAFDQHQIDRRHLADQGGQIPLRLLAQLMQDGPAFGRGDDHLGGAGGAVEEGILAGLVEVETVMGVLERGYADAARDQARNELGDQRGFARPTPAGETDDTHGFLIAKRPAARPGVFYRRRENARYSAGRMAWPWRGAAPSCVSSSYQRLWRSLAQLTSTLPSAIASKAPSTPIVPI